jgi:hypothetical protein
MVVAGSARAGLRLRGAMYAASSAVASSRVHPFSPKYTDLLLIVLTNRPDLCQLSFRVMGFLIWVFEMHEHRHAD